VKNSKLDNNIITADTETVLIDGIHTPYLISFYDGKISESIFNKDPDKLVKDFIDKLFIKNLILRLFIYITLQDLMYILYLNI